MRRVSTGPAEPETIAVPTVPSGTAANTAYAALQDAGFTNIAVVDTNGDEASPDATATAIGTEPRAGTQLEPGARLVLVVQPAGTAAPTS